MQEIYQTNFFTISEIEIVPVPNSLHDEQIILIHKYIGIFCEENMNLQDVNIFSKELKHTILSLNIIDLVSISFVVEEKGTEEKNYISFEF